MMAVGTATALPDSGQDARLLSAAGLRVVARQWAAPIPVQFSCSRSTVLVESALVVDGRQSNL
jgi:hypothetical protein